MTDLLRSVGLSRYELNARLKPALLTMLPGLIVTLFWYPGAWSVVSSVMAAGSACGVLYAIAHFARHRGRATERRLNRNAGRNHSARLLMYSDDTLLAETKARYYAYMQAHGKVLSTADEERAEPELAFRRARSAVDWLLEHTRTGVSAPLLLDENVSYGFQRNLYGLKPFGVGLSIIAIMTHALFLSMMVLGEERFWFGLAIFVPLFIILFSWLFFVTKGAVAEASLAYAQRLLANCEHMTTVPRSQRSSPGTGKGPRLPAKPKASS